MKSEIYNEIFDKKKEYEDFMKQKCTLENLTLILDDVFDEYKLDLLGFIGYTPSWNDGEPCEHSSYAVDDGEIFDHFDFSDYTGEEYESHDYLLHVEEEEISYNEMVNEWDYETHRDQRREYNKVLDNINFILESIYYTNYKVLVYRNKEGKIIVEHEEHYDY